MHSSFFHYCIYVIVCLRTLGRFIWVLHNVMPHLSSSGDGDDDDDVCDGQPLTANCH